MSKVLLQQDNARPHTNLKTWKVITFFWMIATYPLYSLHLALSEHHLFGLLKEGIRDQHFSDDEDVKQAVKNWLKAQPNKF